jgi:phage shock protein PspC (stress-responsive transcriptional regulator)
MQRVISINLNGNAYQLDEIGYNALFAYLDGAETQLQNNPDRAEIMADLEQAVAEKCSTYLGPHKTVVTAAEVDRIIAQMGPVDGGTGGAASGAAATGAANAADGGGQAAGGSENTTSGSATGRGKGRTDTHGAARRLYQIREGAMISGVCNGLAIYFAIDVTLVRIIFVLLAVLTHGGFAVAYLVMMWLIPHASTPDERAAAHGMHFSAQEVIDQAKKNIEQFSKDFGRHDWGAPWRRRDWRRYYRSAKWNPGVPPVGPIGGPAPFGPGPMGPVFGLLNLGLFIMLLVAIASLFDNGVVFGWRFFPDLPRWVGVLMLVFLFQFLVMPLRVARRVSYGSWYGPYGAWDAIWQGIVWVVLMLVGLWLADQYIPGVHEFLLDLNFGTAGRLR